MPSKLFSLLSAAVFAICCREGSSVASFSFPANAPVVVSGAGPASLFFSLRYLQLNPDARIVIYEKRSRPASTAIKQGTTNTGFRAFGFGVGDRGKAQLAKVPGLSDEVKKVAEESMLRGFWFVNHRDLCARMTKILERLYPDRCQIHYNCPVEEFNDKENTVTVVHDDKPAEPQHVEYSLLIAGDGANSVVRKRVEELREVKCKRYYRNIGWKALQVPPQPNIPKGKGQSYGLYGGSQAFNFGDTRHETINFGGLLPRFPGQFVLLMFWRKSRRGHTRHQVNPFGVETPEQLKKALMEIFPDILAFPSDQVLQQFLDEPHGVEIYMKLDRHAIEKRRIAFVGDAAGGMYSTLGQGVASAWQRANLLAETLAADNSSSIETKLAAFGRESRRQACAITDLNLVAHLREIPWLPQSVKKHCMTLTRNIMDANYSYVDLAKDNAILLGAARLLWRWKRVPFQCGHNPLQGNIGVNSHSSS